MLLWVDDVRMPPSAEWIWVKTVNAAKEVIDSFSKLEYKDVIIIDLDHDAGDFQKKGGDYINILKWIEAGGVSISDDYYFRIHSMNPVGKKNMEDIIHYHNWNYIPYIWGSTSTNKPYTY